MAADGTIMLKPTSEPMHLMLFSLLHGRTHDMPANSLKLAGQEMGIDGAAGMSRTQLLAKIISHFGHDDAAEELLAADAISSRPPTTLTDDPFVEGVLDEIPADDRQDYAEVARGYRTSCACRVFAVLSGARGRTGANPSRLVLCSRMSSYPCVCGKSGADPHQEAEGAAPRRRDAGTSRCKAEGQGKSQGQGESQGQGKGQRQTHERCLAERV